ncbi:hypothetical protein [Gordonia phthalatica]|uniref:DUF3093 domain-containing protein n=1 Tax=Gordonia phthalatica TaxID=1136941 RepID=A0A0N9NJQ9_9ACTN|nr:hypothetical protein [Gordonia phthalatica]ALG85874.1 hypothetical protein ACH46_17015 [Gordonia phthalatica]
MTDAPDDKTQDAVDADVDDADIESETTASDAADADAATDEAAAATLNPRKKHKSDLPVDPGETLLYERGGSWWVVAIGPCLVATILIMEIIGGGPIHWVAMLIFGSILVGFSWMQKVAAEQHVSMRLTERTLRQGRETIEIADIVKIFPENNGSETQDWESAPALGELHAVPRRRKGIGVRLANGRLAQAWAQDVGRLRIELTEAHMAIKMGLPPKGKK